MLINADFSTRVVVTPDEHLWLPSPQPGIERVMLDRLGGEKARATSLVRYAAGSTFPPHLHPGGEEILVLSGTFSDDEHYPAGVYLRNPPGSGHAPSTREGATIFVKLWQMAESEVQAVRIDTRDPSNWINEDGCSRCPLFTGADEQVSLLKLAPGRPVFNAPVDGAEILLIDGTLSENGRRYDTGTWIRLPAGLYTELAAGEAGATVYLKTGPLKTRAPEDPGA